MQRLACLLVWGGRAGAERKAAGWGMDSAMDAVWCWDRGYVRRRRLDVGARLGTCRVFKVSDP